MHRRGGRHKASAVLLTALIVAGLSPAAAAAGAADGVRPVWAPPPPRGGPPADTHQPDKPYVNEVQCVRAEKTAGRGPDGDPEVLKNGPWGQRHLRLDDVHRYVAAHSPSGRIGVDNRTGKPLRVAVIDTGVTRHAFFRNKVIGGGDYVAKSGDGLEDCDGHGTQVAGIIAGDPQDPDVGFIGVAPNAQIISIRQSSANYRPLRKDEIQAQREAKALAAKQRQQAAEATARIEREQQRIADLERELQQQKQAAQEGSGGGDSASGAGTAPAQDGGGRAQDDPGTAGNQRTLAMAVVRAVAMKVDVINMSVDACRPNDFAGTLTADEQSLQAAIHYAVERDVVVVAAAGNVGPACPQNGTPDDDFGTGSLDPNKPRTVVTPPWFSEDLLAVAAIHKDGGVAAFSIRGPWVSVAAPGTEIASLDPSGEKRLVNIMFEGSKAIPMQGTSFAAPYVTGLAVLVRQMYPHLTARQVMDRITRTAQHPGAQDGHDQFIGYGVIDPMAALTATLPEDVGLKPAADRALPSDVPPPSAPNHVPAVVALAGSGGALAALGITLFVVRSAQRRREDQPAG